MARPWRLRHKLALGLALVGGSVALLVGGTWFGLASYLDAMKAIDHKVNEFQLVASLRDMIHHIAADGGGDDRTAERDHVLGTCTKALATLTYFEDQRRNQGTARWLDPDGGESVLDLTAKLRTGFDRMRDAVEQTNSQIGNDPRPILQHPAVRAEYGKLNMLATDLLSTLVAEMKATKERTDATHRRSLSVAGSAALLAVILVLTLLHYFRVWVFAPVKAIQAGVQRVHRGDFDHPIRLKSQDEFQELGDEFNAMTARLRDIQKDLARQVDERSRQLVAAEKMVSVGFLAAGVAHEINNPLASIAFCAEALERRLQGVLAGVAGPDADVITKYLTMIEQEAFRCKLITERLLDYSRTGSGRWEPTDLGGLVQNVLELVRHLPASRGKHIVFRPDAKVVATVNANELQGLVNNLVVNALENMDEGGTVQIGLRAGGDAAELVVRDTGVGMPPDVLGQIFEPFYTRSKTGKGTGLGLFISQKVATQHGGTLTAASDGPGRGSTFTVRLPLRHSESDSASVSVSGTPTGPPTVLPFPGRQPAAA